MLTIPSDAAPVIHWFVERYLAGLPLPHTVVAADKTRLSLIDWLEAQHHDRSEFSTDLASKLGLMVHPPLTCETASSSPPASNSTTPDSPLRAAFGATDGGCLIIPRNQPRQNREAEMSTD